MPRFDSVSGCSRSRRSLPSDPASRVRRSSVRPGSSAAVAREGDRQRLAFGIALEREAARSRRIECQVCGGEFGFAEACRRQRADVRFPKARARRRRIAPSSRGGRSRCAKIRYRRLSLVPVSERSISWPRRASSPALKSRFPPSGVPASLDKRPRSGDSAGDRAPHQTGIEGDPQAALDRAVRCRQPEARQHHLGIPFSSAVTANVPSSP